MSIEKHADVFAEKQEDVSESTKRDRVSKGRRKGILSGKNPLEAGAALLSARIY